MHQVQNAPTTPRGLGAVQDRDRPPSPAKKARSGLFSFDIWVDGKPNPQQAAFGVRCHQIQSWLGVSDDWGWFSPEPGPSQCREVQMFLFLLPVPVFIAGIFVCITAYSVWEGHLPFWKPLLVVSFLSAGMVGPMLCMLYISRPVMSTGPSVELVEVKARND